MKDCNHPDEKLKFLGGYPIGKSWYVCECGVHVLKPWNYDLGRGEKNKPL